MDKEKSKVSFFEKHKFVTKLMYLISHILIAPFFLMIIFAIFISTIKTMSYIGDSYGDFLAILACIESQLGLIIISGCTPKIYHKIHNFFEKFNCIEEYNNENELKRKEKERQDELKAQQQNL